MLLTGQTGTLSFYPANLTQLSTRGENHNLSPLSQEKIIPSIGNEPEKSIPIFRFYLDGLIAHVHRHASDDGYTKSLGSLVVGAEDMLVVTTVTFEESFQFRNLTHLMEDAYRLYPRDMANL
jgi:hypothetical protein